MKVKKHYTDYERFEFTRKYKESNMPLSTFANENGISRETLRDWVTAYTNINGKFININSITNKEVT